MSDTPYHYVLTHGLNVAPRVMERLADTLGWPREHCTFVCLPGHGRGSSWREVTAARWLDSLQQQYEAAAASSEPIVYLGFSLGGLLMPCLLAQGKVPAPARQILLAPALAFRGWTLLPSFLSTPRLDQLLIPSFTPVYYKATPGVTIGAYKALFALRQQLERAPAARYNIPTLVLCDQRDELVSAEGLRAFIHDKQLSEWQLRILPSRRGERWGKKHLLVAREYQSPVYWQRITDHIDAFLHERA